MRRDLVDLSAKRARTHEYPIFVGLHASPTERRLRNGPSPEGRHSSRNAPIEPALGDFCRDDVQRGNR